MMNKLFKLSIAAVLFAFIVVCFIGCAVEQTEQELIQQKLDKTTYSRFITIRLTDFNELYIDKLDKRMWIKFSNAANVIEVKYSIEGIPMKAEKE